jgi:formylglycine-generating enzyme
MTTAPIQDDEILLRESSDQVADSTTEMVWIPGGTFRMGSDKHYPEEAPSHEVRVDGFYIDRCPVTNAQFEQFVHETGYITLAERPANSADYPGAKPELLVPSSVVFQQTVGPVDMRNPYNWWQYVAGADWRHPRGPTSSLSGLAQHPVVHVAYDDVKAYTRWANKVLPTEAEWEFAARGGLDGAEFAWGNTFRLDGRFMANTWQGNFPAENTLLDEWEWTSPVGAYAANGYGLFDMTGNVWEWTDDFYQSHSEMSHACCTLENPRGAAAESSYDPRTPEITIPRKVIKGGSHLCAPSYCRRYRPAARMAQPTDTSTCHVGFRCIVRKS